MFFKDPSGESICIEFAPHRFDHDVMYKSHMHWTLLVSVLRRLQKVWLVPTGWCLDVKHAYDCYSGQVEVNVISAGDSA